jgi:ABC-type transporter Mla MlaB component
VQFRVRAPLTRPDLPGLYERACALLEGRSGSLVLCEVSGIDADAVAADALARLQLAARRHRCEVRLHGSSGQLRELIALLGLEDVLPEAEL